MDETQLLTTTLMPPFPPSTPRPTMTNPNLDPEALEAAHKAMDVAYSIDAMLTCPQCEGKGVVVIDYGEGPGGDTCPRCTGSGVIQPDDWNPLATAITAYLITLPPAVAPVQSEPVVVEIASDHLAKLLNASLKPEEIALGAPSRQARVAELVRWFVRLTSGNANPKWLAAHAFELAYFIATSAAHPPQPVPEGAMGELRDNVTVFTVEGDDAVQIRVFGQTIGGFGQHTAKATSLLKLEALIRSLTPTTSPDTPKPDAVREGKL